MKNSIIIAVLLAFSLLSSPAYAQLPHISNGLSYLTSTQNLDGSWDNSTSVVDTTAATVSVLESLKLLNQASGTSYVVRGTLVSSLSYLRGGEGERWSVRCYLRVDTLITTACAAFTRKEVALVLSV